MSNLLVPSTKACNGQEWAKSRLGTGSQPSSDSQMGVRDPDTGSCFLPGRTLARSQN